MLRYSTIHLSIGVLRLFSVSAYHNPLLLAGNGRTLYGNHILLRRHSNNNTPIGGTGKAIRYPMFIKFVAGLRQQLDQQRLVQIFTSCRHQRISYYQSWHNVILPYPAAFQVSKPSNNQKNTALNHPEARKFGAFPRLEAMSNIKTIRMDLCTKYAKYKCLQNAYHMNHMSIDLYFISPNPKNAVLGAFCEAKLPSCTALSPYSAAAFLGMHSAH